MKSIKSAIRILKQISYILNKKQKKDTIVVFISMIVCSLVELLGVSVIYPFLQMMLDINSIKGKWYLSWLFTINPGISVQHVIVVFCVLIAMIYLLKNAIAFFCNYLQNRYSARLNRELSTRIFDSYMARPYEFFVNTNSSFLIRGLCGDVNAVYNTIFNIFQMFAELLSVILIVIYLLSVDAFLAIFSSLVAGLCFFGITFGFKKIMKTIGREYRASETRRSRFIYQSIMGIKEITVLDRRNYYVEGYDKVSEGLEKYSVMNNSVSAAPNRILEGVCMAGIMMILCVKIISGVEMQAFIPALGVFVMGIFRIMPSVAKISGRVNSIVFHNIGLNNTYENLKEDEHAKKIEKEKDTKLSSQLNQTSSVEVAEFNKEISIKNLCFRYTGSDSDVINGLNLTIRKGESVGLIGSSGGGKSTLVDILMTLFEPKSGSVTVDGIDIFLLRKKWIKLIGYVPQSIFMVDGTIKANVAFGVPEKDVSDERVWRALEQAQLKTFVEQLPNGLDTIIGENGSKISGGQRQRIAIARALYDDPEIIIMDEATAALDVETEKALMEAVERLHGQKTIILIAHRLSTIRNCDTVYEIKNGVATLRDKKES